jgi:dTDP-4-dehydrorhamnose 3,5-epimerase
MGGKKMNGLTVPTLIKGGRAVDDRGALTFVNDFSLHGYKRFYTVQNHKQGFIRAWHGHLNEGKAFIVVSGSVMACAVRMTDTKTPNKDEEVKKFTLSSTTPAALVIPAGYANGFMNLTRDAVLLVLSSSTLEESLNDDYRFEFDYWNPWKIEPR